MMEAEEPIDKWEVVSAPPVLPHSQIHVWRTALDVAQSEVDRLEAHLSADERRRAERFRFNKHRRRFIVARAELRVLLALYLNVAPNQIELFTTSHGKPFIKQLMGHSELCFNVSHSYEMGLYIFGRDRRVGIDIERHRPVAEQDNIARHFFTPEEHQTLTRLPQAQRAQGFFNCWTRKEAYIKAIGVGFAHSLKRFAVSLIPDEPARVLYDLSNPLAAQRWALHALTPHPDYVAALACEKTSATERYHIHCFDRRR